MPGRPRNPLPVSKQACGSPRDALSPHHYNPAPHPAPLSTTAVVAAAESLISEQQQLGVGVLPTVLFDASANPSLHHSNPQRPYPRRPDTPDRNESLHRSAPPHTIRALTPHQTPRCVQFPDVLPVDAFHKGSGSVSAQMAALQGEQDSLRLLVSALQQQQPPHARRSSTQKSDLSRAGGAAGQFDRLDVDGDGVLTRQEWMAGAAVGVLDAATSGAAVVVPSPATGQTPARGVPPPQPTPWRMFRGPPM